MTSLLLFIGGLVALVVGAALLVRGAAYLLGLWVTGAFTREELSALREALRRGERRMGNGAAPG